MIMYILGLESSCDETSAAVIYTDTEKNINKILSNEMYTGNMVQHKQAKVNYKSKKKITLDESDWISVEKTHEPLVDEETFRIIKEKRKERQNVTKRNRNKNRTTQRVGGNPRRGTGRSRGTSRLY